MSFEPRLEIKYLMEPVSKDRTRCINNLILLILMHVCLLRIKGIET